MRTNKGIYSGKSDTEILFTPVKDLMRGNFQTAQATGEVYDYWREKGKLPKWLVDDEGDLYLSIGELYRPDMPPDMSAFCLIRIPAKRGEPYGFFFLKRCGENFVFPQLNTYITREVPQKLQGVAKKLKLVAEDIKKKNIIASALWHFPCSMTLWKMHVRGLLEKESELEPKRPRGRPRKGA